MIPVLWLDNHLRSQGQGAHTVTTAIEGLKEVKRINYKLAAAAFKSMSEFIKTISVPLNHFQSY